jgi:hypothetical protein
MAMRKVYTKGIQNANKQMLMAAAAYNLKKILKFAKPTPKSVAQSKGHLLSKINELIAAILSPFKPLYFPMNLLTIRPKVL